MCTSHDKILILRVNTDKGHISALPYCHVKIYVIYILEVGVRCRSNLSWCSTCVGMALETGMADGGVASTRAVCYDCV